MSRSSAVPLAACGPRPLLAGLLLPLALACGPASQDDGGGGGGGADGGDDVEIGADASTGTPSAIAPPCDDRTNAGDPEAGGELVWKYEHRLQANSGPTLDVDGNLYFHAKRIEFWVDDDLPDLISLTPDGDLRWSGRTHTTDTNTGSIPAPVIAGDELWLPVAQNEYEDNQGAVYRFDVDGNELGAFALAERPRGWSAYANGTLFTPGKGALYAHDIDGNPVFAEPAAFAEGGEAGSNVVIAPDGTVYVAGDDDDHFLYAYKPDGTLKWKRDLGQPANSALAVDHDGTVYQGLSHRKLPDGSAEWFPKLTATDKDGNEVWTLPDADHLPVHWDSIQIDERGVIYASGVMTVNPIAVTVEYGLFAFKYESGSTPELLWSQRYDDLGLAGSFVISRGGTLYLTDVCKYLYAINRDTGDTEWIYELPEEDLVHVEEGTPRLCAGWLSSPTLGPDGTVYFSAGGQIVSGRLYAVSGDGTGTSCDAPWPGEQGGLSKDGRVY